MTSESTQHNLKIQARTLDGGFAEIPGGDFRPDATAWAILAMSISGEDSSFIDMARRRLAAAQLKDGRISISPDHPEAYWPTSICVLAWKGSQSCSEELYNAVSFLLSSAGNHWQKQPDSPVNHDTGLKGWPWVADTHSWVEPTSLALFALRVGGRESHPRVAEAVNMLLDRQLPDGGWNYGNTVVYGQQLQPMPDATGLALQALAGLVPAEKIDRSLRYLENEIRRVRTPFSLAWALLGLSGWKARPASAESLVAACRERQAVYGIYSTTQLSLLQLSLLAQEGLGEILL